MALRRLETLIPRKQRDLSEASWREEGVKKKGIAVATISVS